MITQEKDIKQGIDTRIQLLLPTFKPLAYIEEIEKNNFRSSSSRFGVRPLGAPQTTGVTKAVTMDYNFELILTDQYIETNIDESKKTEAMLNVRGNILAIFKDLVNSKVGLASQVMNVRELVLSQPEYNEEAKVVVQRATVVITGRFNLD